MKILLVLNINLEINDLLFWKFSEKNKKPLVCSLKIEKLQPSALFFYICSAFHFFFKLDYVLGLTYSILKILMIINQAKFHVLLYNIASNSSSSTKNR